MIEDATHFTIEIEPDEDIDHEIGLVLDFMERMVNDDVDPENLIGAMLWAIAMVQNQADTMN